MIFSVWTTVLQSLCRGDKVYPVLEFGFVHPGLVLSCLETNKPYFGIITTTNTDFKKKAIPELCSLITETMPHDLIDSWLDVMEQLIDVCETKKNEKAEKEKEKEKQKKLLGKSKTDTTKKKNKKWRSSD